MKDHLSIEQLEKNYWKKYDFETNLVKRCHDLRKIPVNKLSSKNIRFLIGQNIGVKYLLPKAFEILEKNIFIETDFFDGDLLVALIDYFEKFPSETFEMQLFCLLLDSPEGFNDRKVNRKIDNFISSFSGFEENLSIAVFTTKFVLEDHELITHVYHDKDDGAWQFLSDNSYNNFEKVSRLVSLKEILKLDNSLIELGKLKTGSMAKRKNEKNKWKVISIN